MAAIKVLFWFRRRPETRGGDWVALKQYMSALRAAGVECEVSDDPAHDTAPYDVVHIYNLCDPYLTLEYITRAAAAGKPIAVTPIYWSHAEWLAARAAATPETRPEFFLGDIAPEAWQTVRHVQTREHELFMQVHQAAVRAAVVVFSLSEMESCELERDFGVLHNALCVTHYGIDAFFAHGDGGRFSKEFGVEDFVFSAARIEERKNTIGLVRAWRGEKIPLVLAGRAPEERYLQLCRAEADSNVHFLGAIAPEQVADGNAAARVHVMASWWEEMGLAALEAGVAGCNLVMTQNGPGREYFGDACFSCDPADPASIRDAIHKAYDAPRVPDLPQRLSKEFTWARAAEITKAAYERTLQAGKSAPLPDANALAEIAARLAEIVHLKQEAYAELETHTRQQEKWARELEATLTSQNRARERWLQLPLARRAQKWFKRT